MRNYWKKMTKYAATWYAKFNFTCKSHEKCELHNHDNNLYRPVMNSHHICNDIYLWVAIKCAYFKRKIYFLIHTLQVFHFVLSTFQVPFLVNQPSKQQSIYLRRRSHLNIRMLSKNIWAYTITLRSLTGRYKIYVYCPRDKFAIYSNHKHFRF